MKDTEFLSLKPNEAAAHISGLPDSEGARLFLLYTETRGIAAEYLLGFMQSKGNSNPNTAKRLLEEDRKARGSQIRGASESKDSLEQQLDAQPALTYNSGLLAWAILLIVAGIIIVIVAFVFDVGVDAPASFADMPSRVANIDLISEREMILSVGGFIFLAGCMFLAADRICATVSRAMAIGIKPL